MNLRNILLLSIIFGTFCENISIKDPETLPISKAIRDIAEEFYVKNQIQFDFVAVSEDSRRFDQLICHLLAENETESSHRLSSFSSNIRGFFALDNSAIILSFSCQDLAFVNFFFFLSNLFTQDFKFLIYVEDCKLDLLENNINHFIKNLQLTIHKGSIEQYEYLLINDGDFLYLATVEWFTKVACNQVQLKVLNSFNKITQKWTNKLENYEKFQDFHGCNLRMWIPPDSKFTGLAPHVFIDISQKYNFKPKFQAKDEEAEVCFNVFRLGPDMYWTVHFTSSFMEIRDIILVTPGDLYSPYEKLWLPFDDLTWKLLLSTFFVAFIIIFLVNQLKKSVQDIVYGVNVHKPALNVLSAFFGIAQYKVPRKYFSRCLFIIFVYFCLIFRTCYQSKLFEFMTSEPRHPPPKSIADLRNRNYTMYTNMQPALVNELISDNEIDWYVN